MVKDEAAITLAGIEYLAIFEPFKLYLYFKAYSPDLGHDFSLSLIGNLIKYTA
jgi:hypothetical protein